MVRLDNADTRFLQFFFASVFFPLNFYCVETLFKFLEKEEELTKYNMADGLVFLFFYSSIWFHGVRKYAVKSLRSS